MKQVSLTVPRPTLINEDDIGNISLTIKSKNNGIKVVNSWPFASPRYKYDLEDILEISVYYANKDNNDGNNSEDINLYSVFYFPCILLNDIDIIGKKQWILGLERFSLDDNSNFLREMNIDKSLKCIKLMEEKAKKSFKISKIYLIFYSCNKTIMNVEEQMFINKNLRKNEYINTDKMISLDASKKILNLDNSDKLQMGIKPDDSISRVSMKTSSTNTLARAKIIKQNITENSENLSDAIEIINKYINKSKKNDKLKNDICCDINEIKVSSTANGLLELKKENITYDTTSMVSRAISSSSQKLKERKISQERLLKLQYLFTMWRQYTKKQLSIKINNNKYKIITSIYKLSRTIELIELRNKNYFISALWKNKVLNEKNDNIYRYKYENQQINNEKCLLEEKLNSIISDNHKKMNIIQENILIKDKEIFELKKRIEYINKIKDELNNKYNDNILKNEKLVKEINELNNCIESKLKLLDERKDHYLKEKKEFELIIDKKTKDNLKQIEKINYLNLEIIEAKNMLDIEKEEKNMYIKINSELNDKCINIENEFNKLKNDYNDKINNKNKENDELKLENIKYRENNDLLIDKNNKLMEENNDYKLICDKLNIEKISLLNSVYDLINQVENEKIERIQELENSRMLFQSINNGNNTYFSINSLNTKSKMRNNHIDKNNNIFEYEDDDLKLDDLKNTYNDNVSCNENNIELTINNNIVSIEIVSNEYVINIENETAYNALKVNDNIIGVVNLGKIEIINDIENEMNSQSNDLFERVEMLLNDIKKLKEAELAKDDISKFDAERIIGSATEMFKLALKNIKQNSKYITDDDTSIEKDELDINNDKNITFPSEFSFNASYNNKFINVHNNMENKAHLYKDDSKAINDTVLVKQKSNNHIKNMNISNTEINAVSSPLIQYNDLNKLNNNYSFSLSQTTAHSFISNAQSPTSNSMKQNVNNMNFVGLNNQNYGYYYQNNQYEYSNNNYYYAKRYHSLPRQLSNNNNGYYIRTIPPPFLPKG